MLHTTSALWLQLDIAHTSTKGKRWQQGIQLAGAMAHSIPHDLSLCKVTWKVDADSSDSLILLNKGKRRGKKVSSALLKTEVKGYAVWQNFIEALWEASTEVADTGTARRRRQSAGVGRVPHSHAVSVNLLYLYLHLLLARTEAASVSKWAHTYGQQERAPGISDLLLYSATSLGQHNTAQSLQSSSKTVLNKGCLENAV